MGDFSGEVVGREVEEFEVGALGEWGEGAIETVTVEVEEAEVGEEGERV